MACLPRAEQRVTARAVRIVPVQLSGSGLRSFLLYFNGVPLTCRRCKGGAGPLVHTMIRIILLIAGIAVLAACARYSGGESAGKRAERLNASRRCIRISAESRLRLSGVNRTLTRRIRTLLGRAAELP